MPAVTDCMSAPLKQWAENGVKKLTVIAAHFL